MKVHRPTFSEAAGPGVWAAVQSIRYHHRSAMEARAKMNAASTGGSAWFSAMETMHYHQTQRRAMQYAVRLMVRGIVRRRDNA